MAITNNVLLSRRNLKIFVVLIAIFLLFFTVRFFGPAISGYLIGPTTVAPYFQNATRPSAPDIAITNITISPSVKTGVASTVSVFVNVTTINTTGPAPGWNVNVSLFLAPFISGPNITRWSSNNATAEADAYAVAVGDVDGDGDNDIVAGIGAAGDRLSLYVNPGNMNLNTWTVSNATTVDDAAAVAIADMDGDGDNDIIVGMGGGAGTARVSLYNNTAPGTINLGIMPVSNSTAKDVVSSLATGDLDKDGDNDVVVGLGSAGNQISVYNNTGIINISLWPINNVTEAASVTGVATADLDGNGNMDVVATIAGGTNRISAYYGDGTTNIANWGAPQTASLSATGRAIAVGDLDGDGDNDIVAGTGDGLTILNNTGGTTPNIGLFPTDSISIPDVVPTVAIRDVNGDGFNDIIAGIFTSTKRISIYANPGRDVKVSTWQTYNVTTEDQVNGVALGDIDLDGDYDLVAGIGVSGDRVSLYQNTNGSFSVIGSDTANFINATNSQSTYTFTWTPPLTANGAYNLTAVADLAGNFSEADESNNLITMGVNFTCTSLEGQNFVTLNNTTTLCTATYLMNTTPTTRGAPAIQIANGSVTLDCNGATISGSVSGGGIKIDGTYTSNSINYGITSNGSNNVIKGCNILNYTEGILVNVSNNVNITNNTLFNNTYGVFLNTTNSTIVSNNTLRFDNISGVFFLYSNNTTIVNNTIHNNSAYGIKSLLNVNNSIQNNTIYNNTRSGILIENTNSTNLTNNTVSYSLNDGGIYLNFSSSNITLRRNIIFNNLGDGIFMYGYPTACGWNLIENNTITNHTSGGALNGITMIYCPNSTVSDNVISNNSYGVYLYDNNITMFVSNNRIFNNSLNGIFAGVTNGERNLTIYNNTISNNSAHGIRIVQGLNISIENNTIYNNTEVGIALDYVNNTSVLNNTISYGTHTGNSAGIYANRSANLSIKRNSIFRITGVGGVVINGVASSCGWDLVQNNTLFNNTGASLSIIGCANSTAANNTIYNNTRGISTTSNNYALVISDNLIFNNTLGININDDANFTIINNTIIDNNVSSFTSNNRTGIRVYQSQWINASSFNITGNRITGQDFGIDISDSPFAYNGTIYNNYLNNSLFNARDNSSGNNSWNISKTTATNIISGSFIAGNFWHDYTGLDTIDPADRLGDSLTPYNSSSNISAGGDYAPLTQTDTTAPTNITSLAETAKTSSTITWGWTNSTSADTNHTEVYRDGTFQTNTTSTSYSAGGLSGGATYELEVRPVDINGNIGNYTNDSATTDPSVQVSPSAPSAGGSSGGGGGGAAEGGEELLVQSANISEKAEKRSAEMAVGGKIEVTFVEGEKYYSSKPNVDYVMRVAVHNDNIVASVNNEELFDISDFEYGHGKIGFKALGTSAAFDALHVHALVDMAGNRHLDVVDNFDNNRLANWQILDGSWAVINKELVQSLRTLGSYTALTGEDNWKDYEFDGKVSIDPINKQPLAGIVFRARDDDNYYQLVFDGYSRVALRKEIGGDSLPLGKREAHKITVKKITPEKIILDINSSNLPVEIAPGKKVFVDLNRDGQDDIAITANLGTTSSTVKLDVQKLRLDARPINLPSPKPEASAGPLGAFFKKSSDLKQLPREELPRTPIFLAVMIILVATVTFVGIKLHSPKGK